MKRRPFGVTVLAILALIAAVIAGWHTLQMLHLLPVNVETALGTVKFFTFDIFGAILWGVMVLIYVWVFRMLWNVDPQGWLFVTVVSVLNLITAVMSIIGSSSWQAMLPSLLINGLILIYCLLPGTKDAFNAPAKR